MASKYMTSAWVSREPGSADRTSCGSHFCSRLQSTTLGCFRKSSRRVGVLSSISASAKNTSRSLFLVATSALRFQVEHDMFKQYYAWVMWKGGWKWAMPCRREKRTSLATEIQVLAIPKSIVLTQSHRL